MTTRTDTDFWLNEATAEDDICDKRLSVLDFLVRIFPEIHAEAKAGKILEIGCGIGRITNALQYQLPRAEVIGTDINQSFLDIAKTNSKLREARYVCTDNLKEFTNIDFIYSVLVFQHLSNEAKAEYISQAGKALRKNGALLFQYVEGDHASRAMYDAKIEDIRQWCEDAGLKITLERNNQVCERWTWIKAIKK